MKWEACGAFFAFWNKFNKFCDDDSWARILDSIYIYHIDIEITLKLHFGINYVILDNFT